MGQFDRVAEFTDEGMSNAALALGLVCFCGLR